MPKPKQTTYTRVASNKGRERIWLEGRRLAQCGFERGTRYRIEVNPHRGYARLVLDDDGDRVVSGRKRRGEDVPILDIAPSDLAPKGTRVRATFEQGRVEIVIHHEERARLDRERRLENAIGWGVMAEGVVCAGIGVSAAAGNSGIRAGGLDSQIDWVVDAEARYLEAFERNNPAGGEHTRLINARLEEIEHELITPVDFLSVSLPCDGHSRAGKTKRGIHRGEDHDESATAVFGLLRVLDAANPSVIVSENVVEARDSATYALLTRELERRGYAIREVTLNAEHTENALEARQRWFFVALPRDLAEGFDLDAQALRPAERVERQLGDILDKLPDDDRRWRQNQYLKDKAVRDAAAGKGFKRNVYPEDATKIATLRRGYHKGGSTDPVIAHPSGDGRERLLTPAEHARAKGVPPALVENLSDTLAHEGLGQSGLWEHFEQLASVITHHLRDRITPAVGDRQPAMHAATTLTGVETRTEAQNAHTRIDCVIDGAEYTVRAAYRIGDSTTAAHFYDASGACVDRLTVTPTAGGPGVGERDVINATARALAPRAGIRATATTLALTAERDAQIKNAAPASAQAALDDRIARSLGADRPTPEALAAAGSTAAMPLAAARWLQAKNREPFAIDADESADPMASRPSPIDQCKPI